MRLKTASFRNFRLLKSVDLKFSLDLDRPLTVIRAENESGKTSTLDALRWGLFGYEGLNEANKRVSPLDWDPGEPCPVEVEIQFIHTTFDVISGEVHPNQEEYILRRRVTETPDTKGGVKRSEVQLSLFLKTEDGTSPIDGPTLILRDILPSEMRDVFLTDGDAALTYISSDMGARARQQKVESAIRSLLGLSVLEQAQKDIDKTKTKFKRQMSDAVGTAEASHIQDQIEGFESELEESQAAMERLQSQIDTLVRLENEVDEKLLRVAETVGDLEEISARKRGADALLSEARANERAEKDQHMRLFEADDLGWALMGDQLRKGLELLNGLRDRGVIPSTSVPVLQDRLKLEECICGAELSPGSDARHHVEELIVTQRANDQKKEQLTQLHHLAEAQATSVALAVEHGQSWIDRMRSLEESRARTVKLIEGQTRIIKEADEKLTAYPQEEIETLKEQREAHRAALEEKKDQRNAEQIRHQELVDTLADLNEKHKDITRKAARDREASSRLTVAEDLGVVLNRTLQTLREEYMQRVSDRMNGLFLSMVGVDPEATREIFSRAEIDDYQIRVFTRGGIPVEYPQLNGAAKRALTFAFIWALTEVSAVSAPRIVDTPLGMMSGRMKERAVEEMCKAAQPTDDGTVVDKQVVLLLTRAEIAGVESILDAYAGSESVTYTNSEHYPTDVTNDPKTEEPTILVCACGHRQYCDICSRYDNKEFELEYRETER